MLKKFREFIFENSCKRIDFTKRYKYFLVKKVKNGFTAIYY